MASYVCMYVLNTVFKFAKLGQKIIPWKSFDSLQISLQIPTENKKKKIMKLSIYRIELIIFHDKKLSKQLVDYNGHYIR